MILASLTLKNDGRATLTFEKNSGRATLTFENLEKPKSLPFPREVDSSKPGPHRLC